MKIKDQFHEGISSNNPVLVQLIGLCSVLAISVTSVGALGMGLSLMLVLTLSNVVISMLRNFIPDEVHIPAYIVVIASFVTLLQMLLEAFVPVVYDALGIFLPLIVVNCIILGRAEAFACNHTVGESFIDGIANGLGYTFVITAISIIREFLGAGTFFGNQVFPKEFAVPFFVQTPAAFMILGFFIMVSKTRSNKKKEAERQAKNRALDLEASKLGSAVAASTVAAED